MCIVVWEVGGVRWEVVCVGGRDVCGCEYEVGGCVCVGVSVCGGCVGVGWGRGCMGVGCGVWLRGG